MGRTLILAPVVIVESDWLEATVESGLFEVTVELLEELDELLLV